jgi:hypothetical protein
MGISTNLSNGLIRCWWALHGVGACESETETRGAAAKMRRKQAFSKLRFALQPSLSIQVSVLQIAARADWMPADLVSRSAAR